MNVCVVRWAVGFALVGALSMAADGSSRPDLAPARTIEPSIPTSSLTIRPDQLDASRLPEDPEILALFRDLFRRSGWGANDTERAAFLVREASGRWGCLLWPSTARYRSEAFKGLIPEGTVAIVHTHPNSLVKASRHDFESARATGLPLFTLTWANVSLILPTAENETLVISRKNWTRAVTAEQIASCECREIGTPERAPLPGGLVASGQ